MTPRFILDENVIILAQIQENDRGEKDRACFDLLNQIIKTGSPIVVDPILWRKYMRKLGRLRADAIIPPHLAGVLKNLMMTAGKLEFQRDAPQFDEETAIPQGSQDDVENVRLAVATGAILVTTDQPLINDLETAGILETYNLQVVLPGDALNLLQPRPH